MTPSNNTSDPPNKPFVDAQSLLQSTPKFMIYVILSIYRELSLTELSNMIHRKKSTISIHLKQMLESQFIEVAREIKVRGDKKAKHYKLVDNVDERIATYLNFAQDNLEPERQALHFLQVRALLAELNIQFLQKWKDYNDSLAKEIREGNFSKVAKEVESLKQPSKDAVVFSQFTPLSNPIAERLKIRLFEEFRNSEEEMNAVDQTTANTIRSAFCSFHIIPIKKILDHYLEKNKGN